MKVIIVESPAKAKTISKYLQGDKNNEYKVIASYGHVRDLAAKNGSVDTENFSMIWQTDPKSNKRIQEIVDSVKKSDQLILATDPDREGEAIAWHVFSILKEKGVLKKQTVKRITFNSINKDSILQALEQKKELNQELINAYLARRALDYLVGFNLSPILWKKLPGIRSAGRVQSVSLRLVCERENEIEKFNPLEYWQIKTNLQCENNSFEADLYRINDKKLKKHDINHQEQAQQIKKQLEKSNFEINQISQKNTLRRPSPPFTTSTMQQEAATKLGFSPSKTMRIAQKIYEGVTINGQTQGIITYMRSDGIHIDNQALQQCIQVIKTDFKTDFCPEKPRLYKNKAKNAQEAHEAIRPYDFRIRPAQANKYIDNDEAKLYQLIWKRAVASQMSDARFASTTIDINAKHPQEKDEFGLKSVETVNIFQGFLKLYHDPTQEQQKNNSLDKIEKKQKCKHIKTTESQHFTKPPARYSEATLIKKLEELGIGRPSTYASIIYTLKNREYVVNEKNQLKPQDKGRIVTIFLEKHFNKYLQYGFTSELEDKLDLVSSGKLQWIGLMKEFWQDFHQKTLDVKDMKTSQAIDELNQEMQDIIFPKDNSGNIINKCPRCKVNELSIKLSHKGGSFIGCKSYPKCLYTRQLKDIDDTDDKPNKYQPVLLGVSKIDNHEIYQKNGMYGPFVEKQNNNKQKKPKRTSIPSKWLDDINLEKAEKLLSLPRIVGINPESQQQIVANIGKYGPYLKEETKTAKLNDIEEVFDIGINKAVDMIKSQQKNKKKPKRKFGTVKREKK